MDGNSINRLGIIQPVPLEKAPPVRDKVQQKRGKDQKKHQQDKSGSGENESSAQPEPQKDKAGGSRIDIIA